MRLVHLQAYRRVARVENSDSSIFYSLLKDKKGSEFIHEQQLEY